MVQSKVQALMSRGFFPEVVPPCFSTRDLAIATEQAASDLESLRWGKANTKPAHYSGTKRNGHRRHFATCHPAPYFFISRFLEERWGDLEDHFRKSTLSLTVPTFSQEEDHLRAITFTPFNQLDRLVHEHLSFSPFVLKADVAQFYPSLYTHSIPWALHSKLSSKDDFDPKSSSLPFNELDFQIRRAQDGQTRGVLVGPDAHRIIAEAVISAADTVLQTLSAGRIIGGIRHVDDYYLGVASESDAALVLANLREALAGFELFVNDDKTKILRTDGAVDDDWPSHLRQVLVGIDQSSTGEQIRIAVESALRIVATHRNQSPLKLALRLLDKRSIFLSDDYPTLEKYLLRFIYHFPHAIDYVRLLAAKRSVIGLGYDGKTWELVINENLKRFSSYRFHHECCWLLWLSSILKISVRSDVVDQLSKTENPHVVALMVAMYADGKLSKRPEYELPTANTGSEPSWMVQLELKKSGLIKQKFSGPYAPYLDCLAENGVGVVRIAADIDRLASDDHTAIESSRWGYEEGGEEIGPSSLLSVHQASIDDF